MLCFQTDLGVKASALKHMCYGLLYLHCVSEENFGVKLNDFTCATLKYRESHVSYIECLSERR